MNLTEQIEAVSGIIQDADYDIKSARNPKKKRQATNTRNFFKSILESLTELETIKNAK